MYSPLELLAGFPQMVFQTYTEENGNDGVYDLSSLTFPDLSGTKVNWIALPP